MRIPGLLGLLAVVFSLQADSAWEASYADHFSILLMVGDEVVAAVPTLLAIDFETETGAIRFRNLFVFSETFLGWLEGESTGEPPDSLTLIRQPDPMHAYPLSVVLSGCRARDCQRLEWGEAVQYPGVVRCGVTVEHNLEERKPSGW